MTKALEIFFRNKAKLLVLLLLPVLVSGAIVFFLPRSYVSTARLWALHRYAVLGATGPESDMQSTAAVTQAQALTELLQTESFDLAIANDTDLAKYMKIPASDKTRLQDALYTEISSHVTVTAASANLFEITYSNTNPTVAMQVVQAVVEHFGEQSAAHAIAEGKQLMTIYNGQLKTAQQQADDTAQEAAQYYADHHLTATTAQNDQQYRLLSSQADRAAADLAAIQNKISDLNQQLDALGTGAEGMYNVIDAPTVPTQPESRTKSLILGGAVGLVIGLLACIGYFLVLVRLDQSIYSLTELPAITDYPVLVQIPRLPRRSATWITRADGKLLSDKGA